MLALLMACLVGTVAIYSCDDGTLPFGNQGNGDSGGAPAGSGGGNTFNADMLNLLNAGNTPAPEMG